MVEERVVTLANLGRLRVVDAQVVPDFVRQNVRAGIHLDPSERVAEGCQTRPATRICPLPTERDNGHVKDACIRGKFRTLELAGCQGSATRSPARLEPMLFLGFFKRVRSNGIGVALSRSFWEISDRGDNKVVIHQPPATVQEEQTRATERLVQAAFHSNVRYPVRNGIREAYTHDHHTKAPCRLRVQPVDGFSIVLESTRLCLQSQMLVFGVLNDRTIG
mmetsp:Transcript_12478/g.25674  ORF Transcript_12478/g.25674 Transcript_12478/m.25674 type:complete len:220 (-) Transcript_12478:156-815(-)